MEMEIFLFLALSKKLSLAALSEYLKCDLF